MANTSAEPAFDAIIVAGPGSKRLGGIDKAMLTVGSATLLERALAATAGACRTVVVGPARDTARPVVWCEEVPAGGGPVAALAAGLHHTRESVVLLLAVDLPFVSPAVPRLVEASGAGLALLFDSAGRPNYLAAAWQRDVVQARLHAIGDPANQSMRHLVGATDAAAVPDTGGWSADCDTWDAVEAARTRALKEE